MTIVLCSVCEMPHPIPKLLGVEMPDQTPEGSASVLHLLQDRTANIAFVGRQGVGKSKLIETLTACKVPHGPGMSAVTQGWESYRALGVHGVTWWDSSGMESWNHWEASGLMRSMAALERAGTKFNLVVVVLRASERVLPQHTTYDTRHA
jgi:predicted GTPase